MKHLVPEEFVDLVDGVLSTERARHVETCPSCQHQASELKTAMTAARQVEVPEPSPLFWEHFSARVKDAVAAEPSAAAGWRLAWRGWIVAAAATAAAVLAVIVGRGFWSPAYRDAVNRTVAGDETGALPDFAEPRLDDPEWELLLAMTDGVEWSDGGPSELITDRGAVERVFFRMSVEERQEFARLLDAELAGRRL
jgi:hypothetical protein